MTASGRLAREGRPTVRVRCPRAHGVDVEPTERGSELMRCPECGMSFAYLGEVRCARSENKTSRLPGKTRRFAIQTTVTFHTPAGESEQRRIVLHGIRNEPRELVHVRQGHRFSCSEGRTGVYYLVNHTLGEQWNLLRPLSWTAALLLLPILFVGWVAAEIAQGSFHASTGRSLLWAVVASVIVAAMLYARYRQGHALPLPRSPRARLRRHRRRS
jgi:hypothetical protein